MAKKRASRNVTAKRPIAERVEVALAWMRARANAHDRDNLARFGITAVRAIGVSVTTLHELAKELRRDHDLALALWETDLYEARMLACFVDEPARVTPAQMERWARDFDNWALCDAACYQLFDRSPHAFAMAATWAQRSEEFVRRGAFALLAGAATHDKKAPASAFLACLPWIEQASDDARHYVKKGVSWALRGIGHRDAELHAAAVALAKRLAASTQPTRRWIGKDALRDLLRDAVRAKVAKRRR